MTLRSLEELMETFNDKLAVNKQSDKIFKETDALFNTVTELSNTDIFTAEFDEER